MASTRFVVTSMSSTASLPSVSRPSRASPTIVRSWPRRAGSTATSTNSLSQESGTFTGFSSSPELLQEAEVVLVEEADVVDAVADHGHAVDAEAERESGHLLRVVDHVSELPVHRLVDRGVHDPRPHDLEPSRLLAHAAALAPAHHAAEIELDRRLRVGKVG